MQRVVSVSGYFSTGSSAVVDLLHEFEETQVFDKIEFTLLKDSDGLVDLEYHLNSYRAHMQSFVAIERFKNLMFSKHLLYPRYNKATGGKIKELTNDFLDKIIQVKWKGYARETEYFKKDGRAKNFYKKVLRKLYRKKIYSDFLANWYWRLFSQNMSMAKFPDDFIKHAKDYINNILKEMGRDPEKITVINQAFECRNPVSYFKYFDNPMAIIVDRDPRDQYLFAKNFLVYTSRGYKIPIDNVESFIKYYRISRKSPEGNSENNDVLKINFESLVYDYENSVRKVADFIGIEKHTGKGKVLVPSMSRNNTQLFKKYKGFEDDVARIEAELPEFLFPFEKYPDIEATGGMFMGKSPLNKGK